MHVETIENFFFYIKEAHLWSVNAITHVACHWCRRRVMDDLPCGGVCGAELQGHQQRNYSPATACNSRIRICTERVPGGNLRIADVRFDNPQKVPNVKLLEKSIIYVFTGKLSSSSKYLVRRAWEKKSSSQSKYFIRRERWKQVVRVNVWSDVENFFKSAKKQQQQQQYFLSFFFV